MYPPLLDLVLQDPIEWYEVHPKLTNYCDDDRVLVPPGRMGGVPRAQCLFCGVRESIIMGWTRGPRDSSDSNKYLGVGV